MTSRYRCSIAFLILALVTVIGPMECAARPLDPNDFAPAADAQMDRERQTRRFDGVTEPELLTASVSVLQDLGFTVNRSSAPLGLILADKNREAKATEQKAAIMILMMFAASMGSGGHATPNFPMYEEQTISAMLTIRPLPGQGERSHILRVTFHRLIRQPLVMEAGILREAELYNAFNELLSKAIFLQEHKL